jgi:hypothetical protein
MVLVKSAAVSSVNLFTARWVEGVVIFREHSMIGTAELNRLDQEG